MAVLGQLCSLRENANHINKEGKFVPSTTCQKEERTDWWTEWLKPFGGCMIQ
jgi:hypothetical protein